MDLYSAVNASNCGIAERISPRASLITVMRIPGLPGRMRVIKGFTDWTVVRKLRVNELVSTDWYPVNQRAVDHARRR